MALQVLLGLLAGCKKNAHDTGSAASPTPLLSDVRDQIDASLLLTNMANDVTIVQSALSGHTSVTQTNGAVRTSDGNKTSVDDDLNGMELGKPADLFCGAHIGRGEEHDSLYLKVAYDGPDCSGKFYLKGTVIFQVPKWQGWQLAVRGQNSAVQINMNGINLTRLSDHHHISITGTFAFVYLNRDTLNDPGLIASVEELRRLKIRNRGVLQEISNSPGITQLTIHYDDGTTVPWMTAWTRQYYWNEQLVIFQSGLHFDKPGAPHWSDWGTDRYNRPFHWLTLKPLYMYENCHYKIADGLIALQYGDENPNRDSAAIQFGVDRYGNLPSEAVRKGLTCQDPFYLRLTTYRQGMKTSDILLPE